MRRKICVITGTRAEYGLLSRLIGLIDRDPEMTLQLLVTGTHLAPEFGSTYREIEADGYRIDEKVDMLVSGDSGTSVVKSLGLGIVGFASAFDRLGPDLVIVLGDRFEILGAAEAAMLMRIPIAHIHGGEITEGAIDDSIRHAITKMANFHFASHQDFADRIKQMGEDPRNIFVSGAPGIDNIVNEPLLNREGLEKSLGFALGDKNIIVTYHPETQFGEGVDVSVRPLLDALAVFRETKVVFTYANADAGGRDINSEIDKFVAANPGRMIAFKSLGKIRYLSCLKHFDVVAGNSSSGLIEAPTFGIPTVNIGHRQKGRPLAESVISSANEKSSILSALRDAITAKTEGRYDVVRNPYGEGDACTKIYKKIKILDFRSSMIKTFRDLKVELS